MRIADRSQALGLIVALAIVSAIAVLPGVYASEGTTECDEGPNGVCYGVDLEDARSSESEGLDSDMVKGVSIFVGWVLLAWLGRAIFGNEG